MSKTKFREYFDKMVRENKELFDNFTRLHFQYSIDQEKNQEIFNSEGKKVQDVVRNYENRLCANTERGIYIKYSSGLAEKFQNEIRQHYPLYDHIGIKTEPRSKSSFRIQKINLT